VINKLFTKTIRNSKKGGLRLPPLSPPLKSTPDYMHRTFSVQEVTILLNLPQAIKRKFSIESFYIRLLWLEN